MNKNISKEERFAAILKWFEENATSVKTELHFKNGYQLIVAVILSAQCTDKRINIVTPVLFQKYPTVNDLANASQNDLFQIIKSISYPNSKAKHLIEMAKKIVADFNSEIPSETEQLLSLPGVGRKTANVVASILYDKPVIAVDTHVFRISRRLGLSDGNSPEKVEKDLAAGIPVELRGKSHHWLLLHGRYICTAKKPKCPQCGLAPWCESYPLG